ncbi:MAG: exodeoxyribonuclease VII large subunit, partial [Candidatus Omnitrophica bacterium]|nr:exodeoxyribonuclease VII large subunit [Candidatus Omnitrophota bacterium]
KTGNLSIIIVDIDPIYTLGKMAQSRQKIIEDLRKRGLLDKNKQKDIPDIPLNVGLITSLDSAAYHDFTNELKLSGYSFKVLACNCHMQGNLVEKDVLAALKFFNDYSKDKLDVIVITRGGGSTADLSYFDNKKIAEAIAVSNFPVISALGHQINTTITDLTAHIFCKTPTKAAQFLVGKVKQVQDNLNFFQDQIIGKAEDILWTSKKSLQNITVKLDSASSRYFRFHREELLELRHGIFSNLKVLLSKENAFINRCFDNLKLSVQNIVKNSKDYMCHVEQKTKILDPVNTLKRGYSITFKGKKSVKSIDDIQESDIITTVFYKGSITSKVMNKDKSE